MDERRLVGRDADHRLLELHLDQTALGAELDDLALDLDRHPRHELGALENRQDVVQHDSGLELQRGQTRGDLVEAAAVLLERLEALIGLGEYDRDLVEQVLGAAEVERDDVTPLRDRDHEGVGLLGDALGGAVAGTGLGRADRRIGHQLDVGPEDLGRVVGEHDRPVHLRHLVELGRREVDVEPDSARIEKSEVVAGAYAHEAAGPGADDVVDSLTQRCTRRNGSPEHGRA